MTTNEHKVVVKSFSGATVNCMKHYIKPSISREPELLIIHCGTNDLKKTENPEEIANNIVTLAVEADSYSEKTSVVVSSLIPRNDRFKTKVKEVNNCLKKFCSQRNIGYIEHDNIDPNAHLNRSKLHPNKKGTSLITKTFIETISN